MARTKTQAAQNEPATEAPEVEAGVEPQTEAAPEIVTVPMARDPELYDEPHTADVHPDEVEHYRGGGFTEIAE